MAQTPEYTNLAAAPYTVDLVGVDQALVYVFVHALIISLGVLAAAILAFQRLQMSRTHIRHMCAMGRGSDQRYWMYNHGSFWPNMKKHMLYAPLGHVKHNKEIQLSSAVSIGTLPGRLHSILLLLYCGSNIAYCFVLNYSTQKGPALIAEVRGRSGTLAMVNLVPCVLFALRNNPLIPLMGLSYETFNLCHRWTARMVIILATVHTLAWAVNSMTAGGMTAIKDELLGNSSYLYGLVGECAFGAIFLAAFSPVRHAFYETFLNGHRLLVAVALVGTYIHLDVDKLPQLPYMQFTLAMWGLEWVWRTIRIIYHNFSRRHGVTKVTIEALPAEACRVTFDLARPWHWTPGCHVHAYLPRFALWSSHPFSVAWAENKPRNPSLELVAEKTSALDPLSSKQSSTTINITTLSAAPRAQKDQQLPLEAYATSVSLIMRARTGLTRQIYEKASASPTGTITTWGALEGPYGGHEPMTSYGTVVLFAGGVGITHCVGYAYHLIRAYQAGTSCTRKILLVWSVPNTEALEWVRVWMDQVLRMEGRRDVLRIQLFVTKPRHQAEVISNTGSVQMFPGRCNPTTVLEKEMPERIGAMGVTVCGPGAFADSVRVAVRNVVTKGKVDFVEEAFTY